MPEDDAMYHPRSTSPCMECGNPTNRIDLNFEGWLHRACIPDLMERLWGVPTQATE